MNDPEDQSIDKYSKSLVLAFAGPIKNIEPTQLSGRKGVWRCDPAYTNILKIGGQDIPVTEYALFKAIKIAWSPAPETAIYEVPCPLTIPGGAIPRVNLHALVFGLRALYIGCKPDFGIDGNSGPVWVAVNDTRYDDNSGFIDVQVSWR